MVCHLSEKPEPFGRTLTEALACGTPVAAWERGGAAESLSRCFPQGLVAPDDLAGFAQRVAECLSQPPSVPPLPWALTLQAQVASTLALYRQMHEGRSP